MDPVPHSPHGWAAIGSAKGYPGVTVDGFDIDEPSVEQARKHAVEHGASDRVTYHVVDAGELDSRAAQ